MTTNTTLNATYITYSDDRISNWTSEADPWIFGYFYYDWADTYVHVSSINPTSKQILVDPKSIASLSSKTHL